MSGLGEHKGDLSHIYYLLLMFETDWPDVLIAKTHIMPSPYVRLSVFFSTSFCG